MCEVNGVLQRRDNCASDEYCAGPTTKEDATCGKDNLCTKKGYNGVLQFYPLSKFINYIYILFLSN